MFKYFVPGLIALLSLSAVADSDVVVYPHGVGKGGIYVPGFRTYSASPYVPAEKNVALLKEVKEGLAPIKIAGFSSENPGETSLICRLSYPVYLPDKVPYEVYLAEALRAELLAASLYSDEAPRALSGHLSSMNFNSFGTGAWTIEAKFSVEGKEPVVVKHEYSYPVSMGAVYACNDVKDALVPAVRNFLKALYSDPGFIALLR